MQLDQKGILDITDDLGTIFKWNMYKIPVDNNIFKWTTLNATATNSPTLLKTTINLSEKGDVYIDTT